MRSIITSLLLVSPITISPIAGQEKAATVPTPKIKVVSIKPKTSPTGIEIVECRVTVTNKQEFPDEVLGKLGTSKVTGKVIPLLYCSIVNSKTNKPLDPRSIRLYERRDLDEIVAAAPKNDVPESVHLEIRYAKAKVIVRSAGVLVEAFGRPAEIAQPKPVEIPQAMLDHLAKAGISLSTGLREYLEARPNPKEDVKPQDVMELVDKFTPVTSTISSATTQQALIDKQKTLITKQSSVLGDVKANLQAWFNYTDLNNNAWLDEMELAKAFRGAEAKPYWFYELARRNERKEKQKDAKNQSAKLEVSYGEVLAIRPRKFEEKKFPDFTFLMTWDKNQDRQVSKNEYNDFVHNVGKHVKVNLNILHDIQDLQKKLNSATLTAAKRQEYYRDKLTFEAQLQSARVQFRWLDHLQDMQARADRYAWLGYIRAQKK